MYAVRSLLQNAVQVSMATSLMMFLDVTSVTDQPILLFTIAISLASMTKKGFEMFDFARRECRERIPDPYQGGMNPGVSNHPSNFGQHASSSMSLQNCAPVATVLSVLL